LFKGISLEVQDSVAADKIASLPLVEKVWRVQQAGTVGSIGNSDEENNSTSTIKRSPTFMTTRSASQHGNRIVSRSQGRLETQTRKSLDRRNDTTPITPEEMIQADRLKTEGFTGKGTKIAILDSGVR
jgi:subtilase family serine protease